MIFLGIGTCGLFGQSSHLLWYDRPADYFEESLVLGNGTLGASVFGGVSDDQIYLNDATLWSGEPVDPRNNPQAHTHLPAIREALKNQDYALADSLNRHLQGAFSESYAPLGTLHLRFPDPGEIVAYRRELDISRAVSKTTYEAGGVRFERAYFVSHPDQVFAIRLTSSAKKALNCSIGFESLLRFNLVPGADYLEATGYAPYHAEPNYRGDMADAVLFDPARGTRFTAMVRILKSDGTVTLTDRTIDLAGCSEVLILVAAATSFNGFDKNPATEGLDNRALALARLENASGKPYGQLLRRHEEDYQALFKRVSLELGASDAPDLTTDKRLQRYSEGQEDKGLEALYFQYGRYLLISSSRTRGVPANLQGIWNPYLRPPWSSNYTLNINAEENYWLAETANLSELHRPLLTFLRNLAATGAVTAESYYGSGGWAACHNSDIWAMSNPVGDFGKGDPSWANWNMGGAWLATHLWEHFAFTRDREFLEKEAYPLMKGAVQFCLDWMVKDEHGHWITAPGTSPENRYRTPDGYVGATLYGATADLAIIGELFDDFLRASTHMQVADGFVDRVALARQNLHPYQIGAGGNLQEWYFDWEDADPKHRHQTHLFGLFPGHQIYPPETPALADACRRTLEIKGDETTGWSKGWRINLWARLWDGNRAYKMYRELLKYVPPDGANPHFSEGGGTYPNLFDAHPPFQIDGNFGGAAAVLEMLLQSTEDRVYLLPALPDAWGNGSVTGICARGGLEVSLAWQGGKLTHTDILARADGTTTLVYGDKQREVTFRNGQRIELSW